MKRACVERTIATRTIQGDHCQRGWNSLTYCLTSSSHPSGCLLRMHAHCDLWVLFSTGRILLFNILKHSYNCLYIYIYHVLTIKMNVLEEMPKHWSSPRNEANKHFSPDSKFFSGSSPTFSHFHDISPTSVQKPYIFKFLRLPQVVTLSKCSSSWQPSFNRLSRKTAPDRSISVQTAVSVKWVQWNLLQDCHVCRLVRHVCQLVS